MAKKTIEPKIVLEREYTIPLRKGWLKAPEYRRAKKAVKTLKEFLVRHMKIYDRDLRKIKVDINLNNEIRFRGMKKPPCKIKVKAIKYDNNIVRVELAEVPKVVQFKISREAKKFEKIRNSKTKNKPKENIKKTAEETNKEVELVNPETKEKEEIAKEENLEIAKKEAKELKHIVKEKPVKTPRKTLSR